MANIVRLARVANTSERVGKVLEAELEFELELEKELGSGGVSASTSSSVVSGGGGVPVHTKPTKFK